MVVVFRCERNGRQYVRCRTFNRHQIQKIWYPSPRFYMVPVDCAEGLVKANIAAARGSTTSNARMKPSWSSCKRDYCRIHTTTGTIPRSVSRAPIVFTACSPGSLAGDTKGGA